MSGITKKQRTALSLLSKKGRRSIASRLSSAMDEILLGSMSESLSFFSDRSMSMGGSLPGSVVLAEGVTVALGPSGSSCWFADRLRDIGSYAEHLAYVNDLDVTDVRGKMMWADGWRIVRGSMKTPPWMEPHREICCDHAVELVDLKWLPSVVRWYEERHGECSEEISCGREGNDFSGGGICVADAIVVR